MPSEKKEEIMIVDDTPANLEVLEEMLHSKGYGVVSFTRGEQALKAIQARTPELVLLDIMMPDMDGFQACTKMKQLEAMKEVPVIFISALDDIDSKVKAFSGGGVDYVTKPFHEEEVLSRVGVHLEIKRQRQEIRKLLNETLVGVIRALNELLALAYPEAYRKTLKVAQHVRSFCEKNSLPNAWLFVVAANLSNLGSLINPELARKTGNFFLAASEQQKSAYYELATILNRIPRLEEVSSMIKKTLSFPVTKEHWRKWPQDVLGGHLLAIAHAFEQRLEKGLTESQALEEMLMWRFPCPFDPVLLRDFGLTIAHLDVRKELREKETPPRVSIREVNLYGLAPNQVLAEHLMTFDGVLLMSKGTLLNENLCELIRKRHLHSRVCLPVKVYLPKEE